MHNEKMSDIRIAALKAAFPYTLPILAGFLFLGMAYGVYMNAYGFSFVYPMIMSAVIFGGSLEFVAVSMLLSPFAPVAVFLLALMIQARHLFYGIAMLDRFKGLGWKRLYLIYGLCDETFSINYTAKIPQGIDRGWFMLWVTFLNQCYWVAGATLGGFFGGFLPFDTKGLDFVMTAMFVVIFLEQWMHEKQHYTAGIGILSAIICLRVFGPDSFMLPTMILILASLVLGRGFLEKKVQGT
ncbi:AzlC family ABC transporter permease [Schwartzia sp. (in: firmicutes)]